MTYQVKIEFKMLQVSDLQLDRDNPRIKSILEMYNDEISEEMIKLALVSNSNSGTSPGTTYTSLKESIRTNGGIIHPIIVNYDSNSGTFTVVEGNTRVQIYREFLKDNIKGDWSSIPAIVYTDTEQQMINAIRLQAHLVGPRDWDPYSKAKYLNSLYKDECLTMAQIVDFCGGNKSDVQDYIKAYNLMEENYRPLLESDDEFEKNKFSAFREVLRDSIQHSILKHGFTLKDFSQWVIDNKFKPIADIRELPVILDNQRAKQEFLKDGKSIKDARKFCVVPSEPGLERSSLENLILEAIRKIRSLPFEEFTALKSGNEPQRYTIIMELHEQIKTLYNELSNE